MNAPTLTPDQAADQFRAAMLAKQLKAEGSHVFVHAPRRAYSALAEHSNQRRFGPGDSIRHYKLTPQNREARRLDAEAEVFRDANFYLAEVTLQMGLYTCCSITVRMGPADLRDMACRLLDAAHDIETHPTASLATVEQAAA